MPRVSAGGACAQRLSGTQVSARKVAGLSPFCNVHPGLGSKSLPLACGFFGFRSVHGEFAEVLTSCGGCRSDPRVFPDVVCSG